MNLGPFFFAAPAALWALAALPILFLILRATPPAPQRVTFPPLRLLLGVSTDEETRRRAPLWLVLLRAFAAALMIVGFARPSLAPEAAAAPGGSVLIALDDGWTSAPFWPAAKAAAAHAIAKAEQSGASVVLIPTAPRREAPQPAEHLSAADARALLARMEPLPWRPDRARAQAILAATDGRFSEAVWIADGLDDPAGAPFAAALQERAPLTVRAPAAKARALAAAQTGPDGVRVTVLRPPGGRAGAVAAETQDGSALGAADFQFEGDSATAETLIALPGEIAARTARVRIVGEASAGAVRLLPEGVGRPLVGLIDPGAAEGQPLLSELFYVERALQPFATIRFGTASDLIQQRARALVLPDASRLSPEERASVERWLERGGLLIRFAGPRLAHEADEPLPARLRPEPRTLGGALAWEEPMGLKPFEPGSPFEGLTPPQDALVRQLVLAEPASIPQDGVWARLKDGAPVVTAAPRGRGMVVLFHVTASPAWSSLPLSGLYVEMLRRTVALAGAGGGGAQADQARVTGPYLPERVLDGFGDLVPPGSDAQSIAADAFADARPGPAAPPGLYARLRGPTAAIDAVRAGETLAPLALPSDIAVAGFEGARARPLGWLFLALAFALLAADLIVALALAGRLPRLPVAAKSAVGATLMGAALAGAAIFGAPEARAQGPADPAAELHLAYIVNGEARLDRTVKNGLDAVAETLRARTSVEPAATIGVDPARDDLSPYPILYWAAPSAPRRLSDQAIANLNRYMRLGGVLFVDTRDAGAGRRPGPAATMLAGIDAPPLEPLGSDHVLTKAFYLMRTFPGATQETSIFAETPASAASRDGVAALFVGNGDWAAAWAGEAFGLSPHQQELSLRFGVNLIMVALTGNYKADQVHVRTLLERLGER